MTPSRLVLLSCLAACQSGGGAPTAAPGGEVPPMPPAAAAAINPVDVEQVLIDTPTPRPVVADPGAEVPALRTQRTTIGLVLSSRFRCDIARALELREYEGSILGSHGVDVAVTYFVPILHQDRCERTEERHEYRVAVEWERRTDTEWTIAVPGYRGPADRLPGTALFARRLTGHQADAATRAALRSMVRIGEHPLASMTNAGATRSVKATRDAATGDVLVSVTVRHGNACEAATPWRLEPIVWTPDATGTAHAWVTLEPPVNRKACGEIFDVSPEPLATSHLRIAPPPGARSIAIVVPNVARDRDLPVFSTQLALR